LWISPVASVRIDGNWQTASVEGRSCSKKVGCGARRRGDEVVFGEDEVDSPAQVG
jgi:hypothetical protein